MEWGDLAKGTLDMLLAPLAMIYALTKMITDALVFDFHGPMDDYNRIMSVTGQYSWDRKADEQKAKLGYTSREKDQAIQGLKSTFPNKSKEELEGALANMFPGQKQMSPETEKAGGYYEGGEYVYPRSRAQGQAPMNLNVYIDGKAKISKEVSKTMDEHIKADE